MRVTAALLAMALAVPARAQLPAERELSTDRPDKTESPHTVPAGRFQIEMDLATYTRDRTGDALVETVGVVSINLKLGLDDVTDVQLVVAPYIRETVAGRRGAHATIAGSGDLTVRLKRNLWGNDDGRTAFALMPFVRVPTSRGGLGARDVEFGLIAPLSIGLSDRLDLGLMTEVDVVGDDREHRRRISLVNSATLGVSLGRRWGMYAELFTERADRWVMTGDLGLTYALSGETQLDAGINLGLSDAADDRALFVGVSHRF